MTEEIVEHLKKCAAGYGCKGCMYREHEHSNCIDLLMLAAADRLEELEAAQPRWISVEERLQEDEGDKFVKYGFVHNGQLSEQRFIGAACYYLHDKAPHWNNEGFKGMKVTHWMEPPKE